MKWNSYLTSAIISGTIGIATGMFVINTIGKQRKKSNKIKEKSVSTMTVQENENSDNDKEPSIKETSSHFKDTTIVYDSETGDLFIGKQIKDEDLENFFSIFKTPSEKSDTNTAPDTFIKEDTFNKDNCNNEEHPTKQQ